MARLAAIDLGSNAIRLSIVEVAPPRAGGRALAADALSEVSSQRAAIRLGASVFGGGELAPEAIARTCEALRKFRDAMDRAGVERYRAVATSAVREAKNADLLLERAEREAGIVIEVIEGVEEARLVQLAVRAALDLGGEGAVLVDVGGGSAEVTWLVGERIRFARSLPLGAVRLALAFLAGEGAPSRRRLRQMEEYIDRALDEVVPELDPSSISRVIGTGGNVDTLAELAPAEPDGGRAVDVAALRSLRGELASLDVAGRLRRFGLRPDRADTILPAAAVLDRLASALCAHRIEAPGVGLKEGVLHELSRDHFRTRDARADEALVVEACRALGRRFHFDEPHAERVAKFALLLFDAVAPAHGLRAKDRLLLHAGALLHDVGEYVRHEGHHKHGHYLILHSDVVGLSRADREIVATLARYHRKAPPSAEDPAMRALERGARARVKPLVALLRVADALDREHRGKILAISVRTEPGRLVLDASAAGDFDLERWALREKGAMVQEVFGLRVELAGAADDGPPGGALLQSGGDDDA